MQEQRGFRLWCLTSEAGFSPAGDWPPISRSADAGYFCSNQHWQVSEGRSRKSNGNDLSRVRGSWASVPARINLSCKESRYRHPSSNEDALRPLRDLVAHKVGGPSHYRHELRAKSGAPPAARFSCAREELS